MNRVSAKRAVSRLALAMMLCVGGSVAAAPADGRLAIGDAGAADGAIVPVAHVGEDKWKVVDVTQLGLNTSRGGFVSQETLQTLFDGGTTLSAQKAANYLKDLKDAKLSTLGVEERIFPDAITNLDLTDPANSNFVRALATIHSFQCWRVPGYKCTPTLIALLTTAMTVLADKWNTLDQGKRACAINKALLVTAQVDALKLDADGCAAFAILNAIDDRLALKKATGGTQPYSTEFLLDDAKIAKMLGDIQHGNKCRHGCTLTVSDVRNALDRAVRMNATGSAVRMNPEYPYYARIHDHRLLTDSDCRPVRDLVSALNASRQLSEIKEFIDATNCASQQTALHKLSLDVISAILRDLRQIDDLENSKSSRYSRARSSSSSGGGSSSFSQDLDRLCESSRRLGRLEAGGSDDHNQRLMLAYVCSYCFAMGIFVVGYYACLRDQQLAAAGDAHNLGDMFGLPAGLEFNLVSAKA